jgi:hypothetical protein
MLNISAQRSEGHTTAAAWRSRVKNDHKSRKTTGAPSGALRRDGTGTLRTHSVRVCVFIFYVTLGQKRPYGCIELCVLNSVYNILNANTKHAESVVHSLLQHMKLPLLEFRIHGDGSAEFVEAQLDRDYDVFASQLDCIYHLQGEERRSTVLMRNNLVKYRKDGPRGMV